MAIDWPRRRTLGGLGLVLAGGAARGAYAAGVLRFVYGELTDRLGRAPWPRIVSGTSVGAMNGAYVVARDREGLQWLAKTWREIEIPQVLGMTYTDLFRTARKAFADEAFALADPRPLQRMVFRQFPAEGIRRSVDEHGVTWLVGTTDLQHGGQILFCDSAEAPRWRLRPGVRIVHGRMRPIHVLASAALPLLFPPIPLEGTLLVDGGLRQNTPLAPVLRAGADRVLVVSLKRAVQDAQRPLTQPNLSFLMGKTLNALLLDPVEQDVAEARDVNELIAWGTRRFGPAFAAELEQDLGLRAADVLFVTPSEDIGEVAAETYRARPPKVTGAVAQLLERAAGSSSPDADLLSYIYFDREYTGALEQLGFEDARRQEEALARILAPRG